MFKRFFLQLAGNEKKNQFRRHGLAAIAVIWLMLNASLWFIAEYSSTWLGVALNLWLLVLLLLARYYGRRWLSLSFTGVRRAEQWARCYLKDNGGKCKVVTPFEKGDWVLSDAILSMNRLIEHTLTQAYQTDQSIRAQTFLDNDTGVGNRVYFDHRLEAFLAEQEVGVNGWVFLLQLKEPDNIQDKSNESDLGIEVQGLLGYFAVLVSNYLKSYTNAVFARRCEFDFAILIPQISIDEAEKVASRLVRLCDRIPLPDGINAESFFHIGVTSCQNCDNGYQALAEADMALRAAQLQGPNSWFMYERGTITKDLLKGAAKWCTTLETAIERQAFVMLFQPAVLTNNNEIHHHEILARMRDENGRLITAAVFLPMAQKCALVAQVDRLVVEKTVKLLQYEKNAQDICSLNLHIDSLLDAEFQRWLVSFLQRYPNAACRIIIEVSEYALVYQGKSLKPFFHDMHKTGARLLVDQVGLYVLNTRYIRDYEIDYLKLHASIVKNIDQRSENQLFVKSLQGACSGTHVLIFGLGVERVEEWTALQKLAIAGAQGYYFTAPLVSVNQISPSH